MLIGRPPLQVEGRMETVTDSRFWGKNYNYECGDKAKHFHVTSDLCIAFIALREIPGLADHVAGDEMITSYHPTRVVRAEPHGRVWTETIHNIWLMYEYTGFGHADCLTCHERYENARALGLHSARSTLERAHYFAAEQAYRKLLKSHRT